MTLTEMRQLLKSRDILLTKSLGQNFLHDGNQLQRIVRAANLKPTDNVLEIGPGLGPLTELLIRNSRKVLAIELDLRLVEVLKERLSGADNLELLHADALKYLVSNRRDWSDWKLVANLPYSVASPILVELAEAEGCPERIVATLQLEVARRLMAAPDTKDYGVLTLLIQLRYQPGELLRIPSGCFHPEPDVDSGCVTLIRREKPLLNNDQAKLFKKIVKLALSQRRKMLLKLLKQNWPSEQLVEVFAQLGLDEKIRGEKVSVEQFVAMTKLLG
jgi:16S rRNA (adenine1518-N6/adenine1519-N6)-dimethyltransferase